MKATTRTTRWLLLALLFGFLATAGFTLAHHHGAPITADAHATAPPPHVVPQQHPAMLLAAIAGKPLPKAHAGVHLALEFAHDTHSSPTPSHVTDPASAPSNTFAGAGKGWGSQVATGGSGDGTQSQGNDHPATSGTNTLPQNGSGDYAYVGYAPLDCELPAGCGGMSAGIGGGTAGGTSGGPGDGGRQPSGTSGALPSVHNSQGSSDTGPQTDDDTNPPPGNTPNSNSDPSSDPPGQNSNPPAPGTNPAVASAPELDPGTLVAAVTLLFGALAVLLSRRVRAKR